MSLKSNALITLDEYSLFAGQPYKNDVEKQRQAEVLINAASDYIEDYCDRTFLSGSMETEIFVGKGWEDRYDSAHTSQILAQAPISIVTGPVVLSEEAAAGTWTVVSATYYTYDTTQGILYFHSLNEIYFISGRRYQVKYYYGYNGIANIPFDLKRACAALAKYYMVSMDHIGVTGTGASDGRSHTYNVDKIPTSIMQTLNKYVR